jgi:hypothetical protein
MATSSQSEPVEDVEELFSRPPSLSERTKLVQHPSQLSNVYVPADDNAKVPDEDHFGTFSSMFSRIALVLSLIG